MKVVNIHSLYTYSGQQIAWRGGCFRAAAGGDAYPYANSQDCKYCEQARVGGTEYLLTGTEQAYGT